MLLVTNNRNDVAREYRVRPYLNHHRQVDYVLAPVQDTYWMIYGSELGIYDDTPIITWRDATYNAPCNITPNDAYL